MGECSAIRLVCSALLGRKGRVVGAMAEETHNTCMLQRKAARIGNVQILQWASENHGSEADMDLIHFAVTCGRVSVLEWADGKGVQWEVLCVCRLAAEYGHVVILDWIHQQQLLYEDTIRSLSESALLDGNIPILQWMFDRHLFHTNKQTTDNAAKRGQVNVLQWLKDHDLLVTIELTFIWILAAQGGHVHELDWLFENGFAYPSSSIVGLHYANISDTRVLEWAFDRGIEFTTGDCSNAAMNGNLDALKWLREHGCPATR